MNGVVTDFSTSFSALTAELPACRILTAQGAPLRVHVMSHIGAAQWLLGVRMKEHLADLVDALLHYRVFNAALISRAILETAAATVYLQEKLEATMAVPSEDALGTALEELHRSVGGGRYDWGAWGNTAAMAKNVEVYRAGDDPELSPDRRASNVLTMVRKLDQEFQRMFADATGISFPVDYLGVVRATYALLSDICHPAAGTLILLSQPGHRDGWVRFNNSTEESATRWLFSGPIGPLLLIPPVARVAYEALQRLGEKAHELALSQEEP